MSAQPDFQEVSKQVFFPLLRLSGFNIQSHDMTPALRVGFVGPVQNLMTDLNSSALRPNEKLRRLSEVSSTISEHFNKQGFAQPNGPATPEKVEAVLREHLRKSFKIPTALGLVR